MNYVINYGRDPTGRSTPDNAWREGFRLFAMRLKRSRTSLALCVALGLGVGVAARYAIPSTFMATTQLLFDPRGLKVFTNELTSGNFEANAAINFVESQMAILQSEGVLARVLDTGCAAAASEGDRMAARAYCPAAGARDDRGRALSDIQKLVAVRRAERSFVVDVQTRAPTPEGAARLGEEIVAAYRAEEAESRASAARKLTEGLSGRLTALRDALKTSEAKAAKFRSDRNLMLIGDKLLVEQRLASATTALSEAQSKFDRAQARMQQIESLMGDRAALAALSVDADTRALQILIERRDQLRVEVAPLAARAGARHPLLVQEMSKLSRIESAIKVATSSLRKTAQSDLSRARSERANVERTIADLSAKVIKARQATIELTAIEQEIAANRKLLESFETRSREASEFGRIDAANLRVVSAPIAPLRQSPLKGFALWGAAGALAAFLLSIGGLALAELLGGARGSQEPQRSDEADEGVASLQMKAKAFARYRYG